MLLTYTPALAGVSILGGGITYHIIDYSETEYSNQFTDKGFISNKIIGIGSYSEEGIFYDNKYVFFGENSIAKPIVGTIIQQGANFDNWLLGVAIGGYFQNNSEFKNIGLNPFSIPLDKTYGFVPLIGIAVNYKLNKSIRVNNIISPMIYNLSISIQL